MKKFILSESGEFRKINLHCHSKDCSDGRLTLAELKDFYKSHGYAAVAFTDHNVLSTTGYVRRRIHALTVR
jgi:predicted metal-dependent phosphoesterase TrpH